MFKMYSREHPHDAEVFHYSDYSIYEKRPSLFIKHKMITEEVGFYCPNCEKRKLPLEHSGWTTCSCGLKMQKYGNALYVWR